MRCGIALLFLAACGSSDPAPAPSSSSSSSTSGDGGKSEYLAAEKVDESKLGAECSFEQPCPSGQDCYSYDIAAPALTAPRCVARKQECTVVTCPAATECRVLDSFPGQPYCHRL